MFLAMDSQAVMAGTHDQNVEMNVQKARKLRGVNSVDLNKTALRIPVPGTSAFSPRLHPAAGTVPQRRLTEGSPLEVGLLFRTPRSSASSSLGVYRCVSNREREAERPGGKDAYNVETYRSHLFTDGGLWRFPLVSLGFSLSFVSFVVFSLVST